VIGSSVSSGPVSSGPLVVACGALARELRAALDASGLTDTVEVEYLPANLHNRPERIASAVEELLLSAGDRPCFVAYADCGSGGALDRVLEHFAGVHRLPGAHCYEMFAGSALFAELHEEALGTFYLTDFLALHFEPLVWQGLGLDRHPELRDTYFAHYTRVMLLAQTDDAAVIAAGRSAAARLELAFEHRQVGRKQLALALEVLR
jgi:hypothetical protein